MFFAFWGGEYFFCLHATYGDVMVRFLKKKDIADNCWQAHSLKFVSPSKFIGNFSLCLSHIWWVKW
jgi:hypothetical protein